MIRPTHLPILALLTDLHRLSHPLPTLLSQLPEDAVSWVQARSSLDATAYLDWYRECRKALPASIPLLVHHHWRWVEELQAPGVHLKEHGVSVSEVRQQLGDDCWIGQSVHSLESAKRAEREGASYVQLGTVFPTSCKPDHPGDGLKLVREVTQHVGIPVIAVGGIQLDNAASVVQSGATGIAVISAILQSPTPVETCQQFRTLLKTA